MEEAQDIETKKEYFKSLEEPWNSITWWTAKDRCIMLTKPVSHLITESVLQACTGKNTEGTESFTHVPYIIPTPLAHAVCSYRELVKPHKDCQSFVCWPAHKQSQSVLEANAEKKRAKSELKAKRNQAVEEVKVVGIPEKGKGSEGWGKTKTAAMVQSAQSRPQPKEG